MKTGPEDSAQTGADARTVLSLNCFERKIQERFISGANTKRLDRCDLDSHADTCVAGANCILEEDSMQRVTVSGFSEELKPIDDIPISTCLTAYDLPDGETILLVLHETIFLVTGRNRHFSAQIKLEVMVLWLKTHPSSLTSYQDMQSF